MELVSYNIGFFRLSTQGFRVIETLAALRNMSKIESLLSEEWVSLLRETCKTNQFVVTKMKQEDFIYLQSLQENITKKHKCDHGTPLHSLEATAFKFNYEKCSKMQVKYSYCDIQPPSERKVVQHWTIIHFACL
jgi:hypothetical protein